MNKTKRGFTLIELLVVVAIVGILSSAGVVVYRSQIEKANDVKRLDNMVNILKFIRRDTVENKNAGDMFVYNAEEVSTLLAKMNYDAQTQGEELCYFLGVAEGADEASGHDNQIVLAAWGNASSTIDGGSEGVLAVGTDQAVNNLITAPIGDGTCACDLTRANFLCEDPAAMQVVHTYFARKDLPEGAGDGTFDYADVGAAIGSACGGC